MDILIVDKCSVGFQSFLHFLRNHVNCALAREQVQIIVEHGIRKLLAIAHLLKFLIDNNIAHLFTLIWILLA